MPKVASYRLAWSVTDQAYQLQETRDHTLLQVVPESPAWFAWLDQASSFAFWGKGGHYTARKESRPRGEAYWYAYVGTGNKLAKRYLGKTTDVTLARLEQVAEALAGQAPAPGHDLPTGTTTLLFTDIEGSTRLLQRLGERYADVLTACRQLLRAAFEQHQGHEVDTQGDAFFVVFARASDAVAAAVAAQRALTDHAWPAGVAVRVRMGLHTGEPQRLAEGYVGLDTHLAVRIMSAGHGGQVLLSQTTRELVEHTLPEGVSLRDLGEHRLKDLPHPTHLSQLVIKGVTADFPPLRTIEPNTRGDPLLATKLHQPRPRSRLVSRSRLVEHLQQGTKRALTLVSAPAGFGKTTLLAQWLAESDTPVAWLSLEPEDNDPVRFLTYLIAALQTVDAHVGTTALELLRSPQPLPPETVVTLLTNDLLHSTVGEFALVLDDYHVITAELLQRALNTLVEHLPPQLHLMLATRADPPLPLARLRARGQLTEVRAVDLRFSSEEASAFLHTSMGLELPAGEIAALARRTEGWITGLQLAALSLQGRADVSGFLAAFTGSHRFVLDYLSEEVLTRQPAVVQSFLLHTSVLSRLSGPLCDAVTGKPGSRAMLEALERANLFVVALDDERGWYRYHHLFAEVLRSRLQQTEPALVPELHRRASLWYEEQGLVAEAVQHALTSSDFARAASMIEQRGMQIILRGQMQTMLAWLGALPDATVRPRPLLNILFAIALQNSNQLSAALDRLQDAEQHIPADLPVEQALLLFGPLLTIRSAAALYSGDLARGVALGQEALDRLPETDRETRPFALLEAAHAFLVNGDVRSEAHDRLKEARTAAQLLDSPFLSLRSLILLAQWHLLQGRLHQAAATYQQASQSVPTETGLSYVAGGFLYYVGLGDLLRERNDVKQASWHLTRGLELIGETQAAEAHMVAEGHIALARVQQASGEYSQAQATLDAFVALAEARSYVPQLLTRVAAVRAQLELAQGDLPAALSWAGQSGLSPDDAELPYPREREYLALARVTIAQGREDLAGPHLSNALRLLERLLLEAEAKARMGSVLEILVLQSLALQAALDRARALSTLERALRQASPEGYVRLFVDEGTPMVVLLRQAYARGIVPDYVATLLSVAGAPALTVPAPAGSLLEPLTERELEVLRLLVAGLSNSAMAQELVITVGTVKRHVNSIYSKLGVSSRTQAIARAHRLHLL